MRIYNIKKYIGTVFFLLYSIGFVLLMSYVLPKSEKQIKKGIPHNYWTPTQIDKKNIDSL